MTVEDILIDASKSSPLVMTFDAQEMTLIIYEAMTMLKRPPDYTVEAAFNDLRENAPQGFQIANRAAGRILDYMSQQVHAAQQVQ